MIIGASPLNTYSRLGQLQSKGQARVQYLEWLRAQFPEVFEKVAAKIPQIYDIENLQGLGGLWDTITSAVESVIPTIVKTKTDELLLNKQTQRATAGAPPVPVPAGISPAQVIQIPVPAVAGGGTFGLSTPMLLGIGGGALALILVMTMGRKRNPWWDDMAGHRKAARLGWRRRRRAGR